jgi:2-keto-3-deoxy-6-phosphogluconate aldolase
LVAAELFEILRRERMFPIVRGCDPAQVPTVLETLTDEGITVDEIALSDRRALDAFAAEVGSVGKRIVLEGSVSSTSSRCLPLKNRGPLIPGDTWSHGGRRWGGARGRIFGPGGGDDSEVIAAWGSGGVAAAKLFPARQLGGPDYM